MAPSRGSSGNNRLIAVVLVTRSKPGPHIVFHYPPIPQIRVSNFNGTVDEDESEEDLDLDLDPLDGTHTSSRNGEYEEGAFHDSHMHVPADPRKASRGPDTILGYSEDTLQRLLAPGCWSDRTKFEICLNGLTFLGHPIYAAQDGSWAKKHSHSDEIPNSIAERRASTPTPKSRAEKDFADQQTSIGITITEPKTPAREPRDFTHVPESFDSNRTGGQSLATSINSGSDISAAILPEQLTMFNIVFVLAPYKSAKFSIELSDMYKHIAKKLSKAVHYCQNQTQYLGIESKKLLILKLNARQEGICDPKDLCERMIESSELAWALKEVYEKISTDQIAGIRLNGTPISLQIPRSNYDQGSKGYELSPSSGLLLLEEKDALLRELASPDASPLVFFIREHTPTKSLQKQPNSLGLNIEDVFALAQHLVKWRKARIISPLHQRNIYIVGRNAPLDRLESFYIADYARKFAVLPSLPQVLKVLSGKPIKYGMLIPSRDHRGPYMEILAYLMQHEFVEQLKTYGWLQTSSTILPKTHLVEEEEVNLNKRPLDVLSLLSPQMRPVRDDDALSVSSERTTIPISVVESKRALKYITSAPLHSSGTSPNDNALESEAEVKIITNPHDLSSTEDQRRLHHIQHCLTDTELSERLPSLLRHFDGESAFEEIAAAEGLKRSKVEGWLEDLDRSGFLVSFRALK